MEGGEEIVQSGRADEVLIEADQLTGISVGEAEIEVDDPLGLHSDFTGDESDDALVVLAEDLALALQVFLKEVFDSLGVEDWLEVSLLVGLEFLPVGAEVDGEVGYLEQGLG